MTQPNTRHSAEALLPMVYAELRKIAAANMASERGPLTLQATALIHEAYLRLTDQGRAQEHRAWQNEAHFVGAAAEAMRRILVERARKRLRRQRLSGQPAPINLDSLEATAIDDASTILAVHDALSKLAEADHFQAELVKLRFFAGLSIPDAALALGISESTAKRHWRFAQAWLHRELSG
ncbi:MAG TPA: ECF-type sigma factor [Pirellulaceae bacterium]|nr:ECF-type sigma factor [Pirellulaceae bacterium]